jgi:hypothetical protein
MSRKRKSDQTPPTETPTAIAEPPVAELAPAEPAAIQPPVPESRPDPQGFAERVGQKKWTPAPDPFGIATDKVAAVRLFESLDDRQVAIKFGDGSREQKPSQAVIDRMKEARFRWNPEHRVWTYPVTPDTRRAVRIDAEKLYQEVSQMIRREKGIDGQEVPF